MTTCSLPPMSCDTSGGNSDSTSAPTSQNQLATIAPHHNRGSARNCLISAPVETKILRLMARSGAPSPVVGMKRLEIQLAKRGDHHQPGEMDRIAVTLGREAGNDSADQDGEEGAAFDQRVAGRQFVARQVVGQDAVFNRAEQRRDACRT